jgi:alpha-glucosidase
VYLPIGNWYRLSSDEQFEGGKEYVVDAPLADLPVFAKAGGIVVMQNVTQSTQDAGDGTMQIHIWNGPESNSFLYYEDDGKSYDHEQGAYHKRLIIYDHLKRSIILSDAEGSYTSKFTQVKVVLHGFEHVATLEPVAYTNDEIVIRYN